MNRAISIKQFVSTKFKTMTLDGEFKDLLGSPECTSSWIVYGESGNGKTTFALRLLAYLCDYYKCAYLSLEEGMKLTFQQAVIDANLLAKGSRVTLWYDLTLSDLHQKLQEKRAPRIVFVDSCQYLRSSEKSTQEITKFDYIELLHKYKDTLFIFISHGKRGEPTGSLANSIYFGSDICIEVKDFEAINRKNRCGGKGTYAITR